MKNGIEKTLFNNRYVHRLLVVQPQNVSDMKVKVVQTNQFNSIYFYLERMYTLAEAILP